MTPLDHHTPQHNNPRSQELLLLGQIHGLVQSLRDGQVAQTNRLDQMEQRIDERFDGMDDRLRVVEQRSAVAGAISGGAVSVGLALLVEGVKAWLTRPGGP
jgi:hypothetical protein